MSESETRDEMLDPAWPVAELDPVRRLHVLTAALPGAVVIERLIPAPLATVWALASDLEREVPRAERHVRSLRITRQDGERFEALVIGLAGVRDHFAGVLRPSWCWMQGRVLYIGMAATSAPGGTRFALAAGLRLPGAGALRPFVRRSISGSLRRLAQRFDMP